MARILICHAPKDGSVARDLGAALMGRGHFVSFDGEPDTARPDRLSRLKQFEAVIVTWTESSTQSAGLSDIARETLPLNLLVPVKAEDVETTRLPLMFRKLNMLAPRDIDGIARVVARLSTAATSVRDMAERDAQRKVFEAANPPSAPREKPLPPKKPIQTHDRAHDLPPDRLSVQPSLPPQTRQPVHAPPQTRQLEQDHRSPQPERPAQVSPVVDPSHAARARPLDNLPEVSVEPVLPMSRSDAQPAQAGRRPEPDRQEPHRPESYRNERVKPKPITAEDLTRAVEGGLIAYHIPRAMWLGEPVTVELMLSRDVLASFVQSEAGYGRHPADDRHGVETLSISLYGSSHAFEIERQSERTQFVSGPAMSTRDPVTHGRWAWLVTARAAGPQDLVVRISALLRDHNGVPGPVALPDRRFSIDIQVPEGASLVSALAGWHRR